jgi:hypothetical protein
MASDTEFFYVILLVVLTLIMHFILSKKGPGHNGRKT